MTHQETIEIIGNLIEKHDNLVQEAITMGSSSIENQFMEIRQQLINYHSPLHEIIQEKEKNFNIESENIHEIRDLINVYDKFSFVNHVKDYDFLIESLRWAKKSHELKQLLCDIEEKNIEFIDELANSYQTIGHIYAQKEEIDQAILALEECIVLKTQLHKQNTEDEKYMLDLAITYNNLSNICLQPRNPKQSLKYTEINQAEKYAEKSYSISQNLHNFNPEAKHKNVLADSCIQFGIIYQHKKDFNLVLKWLTKSYELYTEINNLEPENTTYISNLAFTSETLADIYIKVDNIKQALQFSKEGGQLFKQVHKMHPENNDMLFCCAKSFRRLGTLYFITKGVRDAKPYLEQSVKLYKMTYKKMGFSFAKDEMRLASWLQKMEFWRDLLLQLYQKPIFKHQINKRLKLILYPIS